MHVQATALKRFEVMARMPITVFVAIIFLAARVDTSFHLVRLRRNLPI